jgi:hypothetical protein
MRIHLNWAVLRDFAYRVWGELAARKCSTPAGAAAGDSAREPREVPKLASRDALGG